MPKIKIISLRCYKERRLKKVAVVKPIEVITDIKEEKIIKEIVASISDKPSEETVKKNHNALRLLNMVRGR